MCVQLDYITNYDNSYATMQTRLCNSMAMHVLLRRRECATPRPGMSTSHYNSCATMQTRLCNYVAMHVRLCQRECAAPRPGVSTSHDNRCATYSCTLRMRNSTVVRELLCRRWRVSPWSCMCNYFAHVCNFCSRA